MLKKKKKYNTKNPLPKGAKWWRVRTPYAVGAVYTEDEKITGGAPIFKAWFGKPIEALKDNKSFKVDHFI